MMAVRTAQHWSCQTSRWDSSRVTLRIGKPHTYTHTCSQIHKQKPHSDATDVWWPAASPRWWRYGSRRQSRPLILPDSRSLASHWPVCRELSPLFCRHGESSSARRTKIVKCNDEPQAHQSHRAVWILLLLFVVVFEMERGIVLFLLLI